MAMPATMDGRVSSLEDWRTQHDKRDDDRLGAITRKLDRLETGAWGLVIALLAWAGVQLWDGQQLRLAALEHPPAAAAAVTPAP